MSWFIGFFLITMKVLHALFSVKNNAPVPIFSCNFKLYLKKLPEFNSKLHRLDY